MKPDNLIAFLIKEAQRRVIIEQRGKAAESALAAHARERSGKRKPKEEFSESESKDTCENCNKPGHTRSECWSKGGGKEGQGSKQKKKNKTKSVTVAADNDKGDLLAFACISGYPNAAKTIQVPSLRARVYIDSLANRHYCPDRLKFWNYLPIKGQNITTADGRHLKAQGIRNVYIELPNGSEHKKLILRNAIHAPDLAFTLVSVSKLDEANCSVSFTKGICTIKNPTRITMAKIPHSDCLYRFSTTETSSNAKLKEYCTYWPRKPSVTTKRNTTDNRGYIHTNQNFITVPGVMPAEGEKNKVIRTPINNNKPKDNEVLPKEKKYGGQKIVQANQENCSPNIKSPNLVSCP